MKNLAIVLTLFAVIASASAATDVYVGKQRADLYYCEADGSNPSTLASGLGRVNALDVSGNYMYVGYGAFGSPNAIYRYDLDGSNETQLVAENPSTDSVRATDSYLYYVRGASAYDIVRTDLDGSNPTTLTTSTYASAALSLTNSGIYWLTGRRYILTCGLDGSSQTQLFDTSDLGGTDYRSAGTMVTDGNYVYYTIHFDGTLHRRDMDGDLASDIVLLTDAAAIADTTSLRLLDGTLYWTEAGETIYSAAADGSSSSAAEQFNMTNTFGVTSGFDVFIDFQAPEPTTMGLLAMGGMALFRRKRR